MPRATLTSDLLELFGITFQPAHTATAFTGEALPENDADIAHKLEGVDKEMEKEGTSEEDIIDSSFGHSVIQHDPPPLDIRKHSDLDYSQMVQLGSETPGGDVMGQTVWQKWRHNARIGKGVSVPPEEDWYGGAKLGEMARPLIMGEGKVGYLNQAPVPMSPSEDLLTLMAEAGVGSRRARHAAMYAKMSVGQAEEFFRLAQRRARQMFHDPTVSVRPGADVFPFYSAASPVFVALAAPHLCPSRCRHLVARNGVLRPRKPADAAAVARRSLELRQISFL